LTYVIIHFIFSYDKTVTWLLDTIACGTQFVLYLSPGKKIIYAIF